MADLHISNGPSKFDLMLALFDRPGRKHTVDFRIDEWRNQPLNCATIVIKGLSSEDADGQCWFFTGYSIKEDTRDKDVEGLYYLTNRTGWLKFKK